MHVKDGAGALEDDDGVAASRVAGDEAADAVKVVVEKLLYRRGALEVGARAVVRVGAHGGAVEAVEEVVAVGGGRVLREYLKLCGRVFGLPGPGWVDSDSGAGPGERMGWMHRKRKPLTVESLVAVVQGALVHEHRCCCEPQDRQRRQEGRRRPHLVVVSDPVTMALALPDGPVPDGHKQYRRRLAADPRGERAARDGLLCRDDNGSHGSRTAAKGGHALPDCHPKHRCSPARPPVAVAAGTVCGVKAAALIDGGKWLIYAPGT